MNYVIEKLFDLTAKGSTFEEKKMITQTDRFKTQQSAISQLLFSTEVQIKTSYINQRTSSLRLTNKDLNEWYTANFKSIPVYTSYSSEEVVVSSSFQSNYRQYHGLEEIKDPEDGSTVELEDLDRDALLIDIEDYILEWTENIYYDFRDIINRLKAGPVFACIHDDMIVIKNLIKFYTEVRKSEDLQLNFFHRITLPKKVSDIMTDMLIILLTDKVDMANIDTDNGKSSTPAITSNERYKLNWLASQQEFAELIHELTEKGFLTLPDISKAAQARLLANTFDFTASQRKTDSNVANNLLTYLHPIQDKETKTTTYSYLTNGYEKKFGCIPYATGKSKKKPGI